MTTMPMLKRTLTRVAKPIMSPLLELRRAMLTRRRFLEFDRSISADGKTWNYQHQGFWVGGRFPTPNCSSGYHGLLEQWWMWYFTGVDCLLISETRPTKDLFASTYPQKRFTTLDLYTDLNGGAADYKADLCADLSAISVRFDLILCQATLEHVYDPFTAVKNMVGQLRDNGVLLIHTHTPPFPYHAYPRDYCRFCPDWFEDLPKHLTGIRMLQLHATTGHVFAAYRRTGGG